MIVAPLLAAIGAWLIYRDAIAAGAGCVLWGAIYLFWWWRTRQRGAPPAGSILRAALPAIAASALVGFVLVVLDLSPAASPFASLLADRTAATSSISTLALALSPVALLSVVLVLARARRVKAGEEAK